jgi:HicA toxin of bacterial toxin-antitoxin,
MADYGRELRKLLRDAGCEFVRQGRGDHEIWFSPISSIRFTVDGMIPADLATAFARDARLTTV